MSLENEVKSAIQKARLHLSRFNEAVNSIKDVQRKKEFSLLLEELNRLAAANSERDGQPGKPLPPLSETPSTNELLARRQLEELPLQETKARWLVLQQSLDLANVLFEGKTSHDSVVRSSDEVIKDEIPLLTATVSFAARAVKDPDFLANDLNRHNGEFKTLQDNLGRHIEKCNKNAVTNLLWGGLLMAVSVLVGLTMIAIGLAGVVPTFGASFAIAAAGIGICVSGVSAGLAVMSATNNINRSLTGRRSLFNDSPTQQKLQESIKNLDQETPSTSASPNPKK